MFEIEYMLLRIDEMYFCYFQSNLLYILKSIDFVYKDIFVMNYLVFIN